MQLEWTSPGCVLRLSCLRESQLLLDLLIEADHALNRVPDDGHRIRLGVNRERLQDVIGHWQKDDLVKNLDVQHVELIRASWFEALDFYSGAEFKMRTGWSKEDAELLFRAFLEDRRKATIRRQWGS